MKNFLDIAEKYPEISLTIKAADLVHVIEQTVEKAKSEFKPQEEEIFLTPLETARIIGIDRSSLWRWAKTGYLVPIEVGGKRRYRKSEVTKIINGGR